MIDTQPKVTPKTRLVLFMASLVYLAGVRHGRKAVTAIRLGRYEFLAEVSSLRQAGFSEEEIAEHFGTTIRNFRTIQKAALR